MSANLEISERHGQDQLIPFLWLRRGIGAMGFFFPVILVAGATLFGKCNIILGSLSDYYHTIMRDVFVAVLCIIAIFLFSYRGPEKKDSIAANLACLFALGIAFFPDSIKEDQLSCLICSVKTYPFIHNISSVAFFLVLSYFSLVLFPKTKKRVVPTHQKLQRNRIYKVTGYLMLVCILIIILYVLFGNKITGLKNIHIIFICEWIALWAFGISWIIKGEWFLQDK